MKTSLLDSDTLSEIFKRRNPIVATRAREYLKEFGSFTFSIVSWYEVVRGLRVVNATAQLVRFDTFCSHSIILPASTRTFDSAADFWVACRGSRHRSFDADLLIAATAFEHGMTLVTGNISHFQSIPQLVLDDWRIPPST
jgi:tRNA(fMet)-specific endonuclease VapC